VTTYSSPGIGPDGTIYVGGDNGILHAINPSGSQKGRGTRFFIRLLM
jgi:hypothetical protein